jgi:hypothetical protein
VLKSLNIGGFVESLINEINEQFIMAVKRLIALSNFVKVWEFVLRSRMRARTHTIIL